MTAKKLYVLDTSVLLTNAFSIYSFRTHNIILPLKVLEEVDGHKKKQDIVGANARKIIRILDELRAKGDLSKGVRIQKGKGLLTVVPIIGENTLPKDLSRDIPDHIILQTAYNYALENNCLDRTILVSRDVNMRVTSQCIGMKSEDYNAEDIAKTSEDFYKGFKDILVDDEVIDRFYSGEEIILHKEDNPGLMPNHFLMLISSTSDKKTALARFNDYEMPLKKVFKNDNVWGLSSRNKEQSFALDLLMDPDVKIVTLVGKAGSGKTLCALGAGLEQVINGKHGAEYTRLIVSRPVQPLGKDIGFLPGTMEEKMIPWLSPIQDNLKYLMANDKIMLEEYMDKGTIEIEALTFIRGRSISKAFMIIDEAQNLTRHELKTIITRVGEGTKIVLTGDVEQIDNVYITETTNGLVHAVEKFKEYKVAGHITLSKGERSEVATLGAKIL